VASGDGIRTLNVTSCKEVHRGTGNNGPYVMYEVEATDEQGVVVNQKLNAFDNLPIAKGRFKVKPYKKNGQIVSYTLQPVEGTLSGSAAIAQRVEFMEEQIKFLNERERTLTSVVEDLQEQIGRLQSGAPAQAPKPPPTSDDDIPF
jgi:hypothetical protein